MRASSGRLQRLVVTYELAADGTLVPAGPPRGRVPAVGEGLLYRALARCANADDFAIAAAASRLGPLGPTGPIASFGDERLVGYRLGGSAAGLIAQLDELDHWLASGGGLAIPIPARLSAAAYLVAAFADIDTELQASLLRAVEDEPLLPEERVRARARLWTEALAAMARYQALAASDADNPAEGDRPVYVRVAAGTTAAQLRLARRLLRATWRAIAHDGGLGAVLEAGNLGSFATLTSQFPIRGQTLLAAPETVADWRNAGLEMAEWQEAVRILRASAGRQALDSLRWPTMANLRRFAGIREAPAAGAVALAGGPGHLNEELVPLLTLRLQQVDAWPLPEGEVVGTFGRALWSLWSPITAREPIRRCQWRDGCSRLMAEGSHGNRRYCEEHRKEASRMRARRNRSQRHIDLMLAEA